METYIAAENIDLGSDCMVVARTNRGIFVAVHDGNRPNIGQASELLPKGRAIQLIAAALSLTEDERIYKVPFMIS